MAQVTPNASSVPTHSPDVVQVLRNRRDVHEAMGKVVVYDKEAQYRYDPESQIYTARVDTSSSITLSSVPSLLETLFLEAGLAIVDTHGIPSDQNRAANNLVNILRRKHNISLSGAVITTEKGISEVSLFINEETSETSSVDPSLTERLDLKPVKAYPLSPEEVVAFVEDVASPKFCWSPHNYFYSALSDGINDIALVRRNSILSSGMDVNSLYRDDGTPIAADNHFIFDDQGVAIGIPSGAALFEESENSPVGYWVFDDGNSLLPVPTTDPDIDLYDTNGDYVASALHSESYFVWGGESYVFDPDFLPYIIGEINDICTPYQEEIQERISAGEDFLEVINDDGE